MPAIGTVFAQRRSRVAHTYDRTPRASHNRAIQTGDRNELGKAFDLMAKALRGATLAKASQEAVDAIGDLYNLIEAWSKRQRLDITDWQRREAEKDFKTAHRLLTADDGDYAEIHALLTQVEREVEITAQQPVTA